MPFQIITQPASLTAVPGQDSTFTFVTSSNDVSPLSANYTYQWYLSSGVTRTPISSQTNSTYTVDPLIEDSGKVFFATSTFLSGAPATTFVSTLTSNNARLTVNEDVKPFDTYDVGSETGRQRHLRLRLLGYI
jgi:hypothetical protein